MSAATKLRQALQQHQDGVWFCAAAPAGGSAGGWEVFRFGADRLAARFLAPLRFVIVPVSVMVGCFVESARIKNFRSYPNSKRRGVKGALAGACGSNKRSIAAPGGFCDIPGQ
jgi:hypothetical protein